MELGYSPESFWEYSLAEVLDLLEAHRKRNERRQKEKLEEIKNLAVILQVQALQIGQTFGGCDDQHPFRTVQDYFPALFPTDQTQEERLQQKQLDDRNARMRAYAAQHNARIQAAGGGEE